MIFLNRKFRSPYLFIFYFYYIANLVPFGGIKFSITNLRAVCQNREKRSWRGNYFSILWMWMKIILIVNLK